MALLKRKAYVLQKKNKKHLIKFSIMIFFKDIYRKSKVTAARERARKTGRVKEIYHSSTGSLYWPRTVPGARNSSLVPVVGGRNPRSWAVICPVPRCMGRKPGRK